MRESMNEWHLSMITNVEFDQINLTMKANSAWNFCCELHFSHFTCSIDGSVALMVENKPSAWNVQFHDKIRNTALKLIEADTNGRHFADDIFKCIFLNENVWIPIKISLKFVPKGPINNIPALVQIMAWRRPGDKPLSEPMVVSLPTHICVARPQWVYQTTSIGVLCVKPFRDYNLLECNSIVHRGPFY